MALKEKQLDYVKKVLSENRKITRNQALKQGITRLSAIIWILRHEYMFEIKGKRLNNGTKFFDYGYFLDDTKVSK